MEYKKRAISDLEKKKRIEHIIGIAEKLLTDGTFHEITMAKIAQEAGLAKGTLFIYFQTKEDVFLTLMEQKMIDWSNNLAKELKGVPQGKNNTQIDEFIEIILNSVNNSVFLKLLAILDDTLEQNIDLKRAVQFKTFLKDKLSVLGDRVEKILPMLHKGDGMIVLGQLFICLIGAYKVSNPSNIVRQAVREPGLEFFDRDFFKTLRDMVTCHMIGYVALNRRQ